MPSVKVPLHSLPEGFANQSQVDPHASSSWEIPGSPQADLWASETVHDPELSCSPVLPAENTGHPEEFGGCPMTFSCPLAMSPAWEWCFIVLDCQDGNLSVLAS